MKFAKMTAEQKATYEATKAQIQAQIRLENAKYDAEQAAIKRRAASAAANLQRTIAHKTALASQDMLFDPYIAPKMAYKRTSPFVTMVYAVLMALGLR